MIRGHLTQLVFGLALVSMGCTGLLNGANKAATVYIDRISPATTQAVTPVLQIAAATAATTPVGSPLNSAALIITAITGGILAIDKLFLGLAGTIKLVTGKPTPIPVPEPPVVLTDVAGSGGSLQLPGKGGPL